MKWDPRLWVASLRFQRLRARLQHDQAVEHGRIVDDVKEARRSITHDLADKVLELDAVTDQLEDQVEDDDDETDP